MVNNLILRVDCQEQEINKLIENGYTYESEDAIWLKTTMYGDEKDRRRQRTEQNSRQNSSEHLLFRHCIIPDHYRNGELNNNILIIMYARTLLYKQSGGISMKQQVNLEIMDFVEKQILPKYNAFGESHGLRHVTRVIRNSLKLVPVTGADIDMVYVIAAYHDLGMSGPRAIHHITSSKILQADSRLKRWFNKEQIKIMKEAVEDHRASSSRQPRSIYGKIVAEADRDIDVHEIFLRAIQYGKENNPDDDKEQQWERFSQHMDEKYSRNGYIRLWIPNSPNEKALNKLRNIIEDKTELKKYFEKIFEENS